MMEAGHQRWQPIVMATVAMVAGMLPIALGLTGDSSWRAPMGIVVIGGLILSTMLTLVIVPAGFTLADDLERWLGRSEEHTSELQSLMRISYAVFCLKKKKENKKKTE